MNKHIKSWMGIFGFLGLLGIISFPLKQPVYLLFFSFFGFFSFYWWGKLSDETRDERMIENHLNAFHLSQRVGFSIIFIGAILINVLLKNISIDHKYAIMLMLVAVGISTTNIMTAFLTYKYDTK